MDNNIIFETALSELEAIIEKLENDETPLDEALKLYEKGIALIRVCTDRLDSAEQKIRLLQQKDGKVVGGDSDVQ